LVLAWRNAGLLGLDRFALSGVWRRNQLNRVGHRSAQRRASTPTPVLTH
jgi:hypothetical protein